MTLEDSDGKTPLHHAVRLERTNISRILIERGVSVEKRDGLGLTPLHLAAAKGSLEQVQLLIEHGADIATIIDSNGETTLHFAAQNSHTDVLRFVLEHGPLDVNCETYLNVTALHHAVVSGKAEGCELLLRRGANVDSKIQGRETPLFLGVHLDKVDCVRVLLKYGADVRDKPYGQNSTLQSAIKFGKRAVKKSVLQHVTKMEFWGIRMNQDDYSAIENDTWCNQYYQLCERELKRMEADRFYNNVSVLNILIGSDRVIFGYARNKELVEVLRRKNLKKLFPIYFTSLKKRVSAAVDAQRIRHAGAIILSDIFQFNDSFHVINQKILNHLTMTDIKFLKMHA